MVVAVAIVVVEEIAVAKVARAEEAAAMVEVVVTVKTSSNK